jgi:peptidoglycan/LPS O-acetylase OafA/YrhL
MTSSVNPDKLRSILNLQTFGILLVVLGHSIPRGRIDTYPPDIIWLHSFIYSFHMPLFMFISGYLFIHSNRDRSIEYAHFIKDKAIRLLIPYITLSTLAFFPKVVLSKYANRPIDFSFVTYIQGIIYPTENPIKAMWFLPVLFSIFIAAPFLRTMINQTRLAATLAVLGALALLNIFNPVYTNVFGLQITMDYLFYFFLGCLTAAQCAESLNRSGKIHLVLITLTALILVNLFLPQLTAKIPMLLAAFIGICFSVSLACFMDNHGWKFFGYIDGYSYQIYLLSWFVQIFFRILYQINIINEYICFILMLSCGALIPVLIARFIERKLPIGKIFVGMK